MEEAEHCDRLAILNLGNVVALGTPDELRSEIGADIVELEAADPESLAPRISERFATHATVLNGKVRFEAANGHRLIPPLMEAFPGAVRSVMVSKPSLEDVFIRRTGHRFWNEINSESTTAADKGAPNGNARQ
jgi:ABC-2 type transport system ATP-binding protein